jgi:hypothetical protein
MDGLCDGCVDFDSSEGFVGNANGGVVEKKRALAGGEGVDVEYGKGINGGGGVRYWVSDAGIGGVRVLFWNPPFDRVELGVGEAATST